MRESFIAQEFVSFLSLRGIAENFGGCRGERNSKTDAYTFSPYPCRSYTVSTSDTTAATAAFIPFYSPTLANQLAVMARGRK